jgi:hypothetical protein
MIRVYLDIETLPALEMTPEQRLERDLACKPAKTWHPKRWTTDSVDRDRWVAANPKRGWRGTSLDPMAGHICCISIATGTRPPVSWVSGQEAWRDTNQTDALNWLHDQVARLWTLQGQNNGAARTWRGSISRGSGCEL